MAPVAGVAGDVGALRASHCSMSERSQPPEKCFGGNVPCRVQRNSVDRLRTILIFADEVLRAGHHYEVRVNGQTDNPRIVEVIQELER